MMRFKCYLISLIGLTSYLPLIIRAKQNTYSLNVVSEWLRCRTFYTGKIKNRITIIKNDFHQILIFKYIIHYEYNCTRIYNNLYHANITQVLRAICSQNVLFLTTYYFLKHHIAHKIISFYDIIDVYVYEVSCTAGPLTVFVPLCSRVRQIYIIVQCTRACSWHTLSSRLRAPKLSRLLNGFHHIIHVPPRFSIEIPFNIMCFRHVCTYVIYRQICV